jgi:hypothetical protein
LPDLESSAVDTVAGLRGANWSKDFEYPCWLPDISAVCQWRAETSPEDEVQWILITLVEILARLPDHDAQLALVVELFGVFDVATLSLQDVPLGILESDETFESCHSQELTKQLS